MMPFDLYVAFGMAQMEAWLATQTDLTNTNRKAV